jgi:hypothetical protein
MTTEEIKELAQIEREYRKIAYKFVNPDDGYELTQYFKAAAVIDFIRKDIKSIVADAVKAVLANHTENDELVWTVTEWFPT